MADSRPTSNMTVADVLEFWPETVPVFQKLKTDCVGCPMAPFDTLSDVSKIYEIDMEQLMDVLNESIRLAGDGQQQI
jgi:hybrid cluster-associated redox disulfide protein